MLATATAQEAIELRAAGINARIIVMGAVSSDELPLALAADADLVAWDERFVEMVRRGGAHAPVRLHVKLDTGMGRFGTRDPQLALRIARTIADGGPQLRLAGGMTHLATADSDQEFVDHQLQAFVRSPPSFVAYPRAWRCMPPTARGHC